MLNRLKNMAALRLLIRQLTGNRSCDPDQVRSQCKTVLYACFKMGIEPFQLPIADDSVGDLSEAQKRDFLRHYLFLHMDRPSQDRAAAQLVNGKPAWSALMQLVDEIIDQQNR
ncbi:MAG: hypothetical protein JXB25_01290 [Deltaproteobacteria bacterium]|nr:hypothetical protein [Deltaproteobacteria bacterium]